jgi:hypothetical protein
MTGAMGCRGRVGRHASKCRHHARPSLPSAYNMAQREPEQPEAPLPHGSPPHVLQDVAAALLIGAPLVSAARIQLVQSRAHTPPGAEGDGGQGAGGSRGRHTRRRRGKRPCPALLAWWPGALNLPGHAANTATACEHMCSPSAISRERCRSRAPLSWRCGARPPTGQPRCGSRGRGTRGPCRWGCPHAGAGAEVGGRRSGDGGGGVSSSGHCKESQPLRRARKQNLRRKSCKTTAFHQPVMVQYPFLPPVRHAPRC